MQPNTGIQDIRWHRLEYDPIKRTGFVSVTQRDLALMFTDPMFWMSLEIFAGVYPIIKQLSNEYEVHIVTARYWYNDIEKATRYWLQQNNIPFDYLISAPSNQKWQYAIKNNLDWFIEDSIEAANLIAPVVKTVFLIDRPWNKSEQIVEGCVRTNWDIVCQRLIINKEGTAKCH
jgi:5'(3')-deoxyribonucleotidase